MFKNNKKSNSNLFFNYGKFSKRYKKHEYNNRYDKFKTRWKSRKEFCEDLIKDNIENNKDIKEPEIPVMKRINKSLIYFPKLKQAVIIK